MMDYLDCYLFNSATSWSQTWLNGDGWVNKGIWHEIFGKSNTIIKDERRASGCTGQSVLNARLEEKKKATERLYGCSERYAEGYK